VKFDPISIHGLGIEVFFEWYRCMDVRINVICIDLIFNKMYIAAKWAFRFYLIHEKYVMFEVKHIGFVLFLDSCRG
jgi:hypothetical protein